MPTLIPNPHEALADEASQVHARLDPKVFNYFFRQLLPGDRGVKSALICTFFQALYDECQRLELKPEWDPSNASKLTDMLGRLNFSHTSIGHLLQRFPSGFIVDSNGGVSASPRRTAARASNGSDKHPPKGHATR